MYKYRQLKFRAWDDKNKKWLFGYEYPNLGGFSLTGEVVLLGEISTPSLKDWNHINIDQFTGLKDRNDKDIYEGDIVRLLYTDWPSKPSEDPRSIDQYMIDIAGVYEVVYELNEFCVKCKNRYDEDNFNSILPGKHGYIEVIGNVNQNSNLLNK